MDLKLSQEIVEQKKRSVLMILTGPTAAGKDTVIAELVKRDPNIVKVVTTTSRKMREGESQENPYHFLSRETFEKLISESAFFEWVEFRGELYGTQKKTLEEALGKNATVILKIETKGVKNIQEKIRASVPRSLFIYITGTSLPEMKKRVVKNEDADADALARWNEPLVIWELKQFEDADYLVINEDGKLSEAVAQIEAIVAAKRLEILPETPASQLAK